MSKGTSPYDPDIRRSLEGNGIKKKKRPVAVLPLGSVEQHGAHLPVTTDTDIVAEVAARLAAKMGSGMFAVLLLPPIYYGVSREHSPMFHASVTPSLLRRQVGAISSSLEGFSRLFVINGHYTNKKALEPLNDGRPAHKTGPRTHVISYWEHTRERFDHAGRVETSLMLAVRPDLVRMKLARKGFDDNGLTDGELATVSRRASRSFPSVALNGVWGDPTSASAGLGRRILSEVTASAGRECLRLAGGERSSKTPGGKGRPH